MEPDTRISRKEIAMVNVKDCPKCGADSYVIDSRISENTEILKRRRKCQRCGHRWSTGEIEYDIAVEATEYRRRNAS